MTADIYVWFALVSLTGSLRSQIKFTQFSLSLSLSSFFIIWEVHVSKSSHRKLETMMIVLSVKTSHCGIIKTGRNFYFLKESKKEKEKCSECNITFKSLIQWKQPYSFKFFVYFTKKKFTFFYFTHLFL